MSEGPALRDFEIGEYTGCTHGAEGGRLYGCLDCAIQWQTQEYEKATARANSHYKMREMLRAEQTRRLSRAASTEDSARTGTVPGK